MNWSGDNCMKIIPGKYHLLLPGNDSSKIPTEIKCSLEVNGIKIDNNLNSKEHIEF